MWKLCSGLSILTSLAPMKDCRTAFSQEHRRHCDTMELEHVGLYCFIEWKLCWIEVNHSCCSVLSITTLFLCEAFILCNKFCLDLLFCTESPPSSHNQIAFVQTKWFNHQCWNGRCLTDWLGSEIINQKM